MSGPADNPYGDSHGDRRHSRQRRRAPRPLTEALADLQGGVVPPTLLARVQEQWAAAAGAQIAAEATPVTEANGQITISCSSSVWASELTMMAPALLERLNERLGSEARAQALRFVAGGPSSRP